MLICGRRRRTCKHLSRTGTVRRRGIDAILEGTLAFDGGCLRLIQGDIEYPEVAGRNSLGV